MPEVAFVHIDEVAMAKLLHLLHLAESVSRSAKILQDEHNNQIMITDLTVISMIDLLRDVLKELLHGHLLLRFLVPCRKDNSISAITSSSSLRKKLNDRQWEMNQCTPQQSYECCRSAPLDLHV